MNRLLPTFRPSFLVPVRPLAGQDRREIREQVVDPGDADGCKHRSAIGWCMGQVAHRGS